MRFVTLGFALVAATWLVLVAAAPHAALGGAASGTTYAFGALICHQRADRSFHVGSGQLPVCARCCGLYLGAAIGACVFVARRRRGRVMAPDGLRAILLVTAAPTAMTWVVEAIGIGAPGNVTRFVAALPLGVAVALTVNYLECAQPQRTEFRTPLTPT